MIEQAREKAERCFPAAALGCEHPDNGTVSRVCGNATIERSAGKTASK
jgi:hypothetical protein